MGLEQVYWTLPIVAYPYISGLIAGSFIVGSLSKVFGQKQYEPLTKLSLLVTFAFILFAPVGPLADARQPSRWWELFTRPHLPWAPMGLFTMIWTAYLLLVLAEMYLAFRVDFCRLAAVETGWRAGLYRVLALGSTDTSERRQSKEHKWQVGLAGTGIFLAFAFHGYIGFIFGAIKARPLWHNALMMPMFITSAILSGIALMIVVYTLTFRYFSRERQVDVSLTNGLMKIMTWVMLVDLFLDIVDVLNSAPTAYADAATGQGFAQVFLHGPLAGAYWFGQVGLLVLALILAFLPQIRRSALLASLTSLLVLVSVFFMRYNVVIGGQLQAKASQGLVLYTPALFGRGSVQVVFGMFMLILFVFLVVMNVFPWDDQALRQRLALGNRLRVREQAAKAAGRQVP
ncbi:Polysulphide reductase, NrfD [Acididesulfobacillus acetoxydans]|uniref:Polysulphide reductase NrfD n=1 Tax=Acididesulfobacillus acetoxydans TaxID=1561005 RepID=A0A8S0W3A3_9FIRM|nr:NrfD/PsrC family molybdoenzyme membrane anchor subunit [Acididesulfobacillus acetoxydans]CAA7601468.1 Polysulphide reductase, NrfD [Acididesulfobacillus acetoxydans]CEJ06123.1 Polysulphide reductase NrfD [Acididesulfobacillus acetoxydans]